MLKREFEERFTNADKITKTMALKQKDPIVTPSRSIPLNSPATIECSKFSNIEKAHKRGNTKRGVAFFMLKSTTPLSSKMITAKKSKILIIKIKG